MFFGYLFRKSLMEKVLCDPARPLLLPCVFLGILLPFPAQSHALAGIIHSRSRCEAGGGKIWEGTGHLRVQGRPELQEPAIPLK
jgi:hypothetical protein